MASITRRPGARALALPQQAAPSAATEIAAGTGQAPAVLEPPQWAQWRNMRREMDEKYQAATKGK